MAKNPNRHLYEGAIYGPGVAQKSLLWIDRQKGLFAMLRGPHSKRDDWRPRRGRLCLHHWPQIAMEWFQGLWYMRGGH